MSQENDITNLYRQFGGQPDGYKEITRDENTQNARTRWPLLNAVPASHDPVPPAAIAPEIQQDEQASSYTLYPPLPEGHDHGVPVFVAPDRNKLAAKAASARHTALPERTEHAADAIPPVFDTLSTAPGIPAAAISMAPVDPASHTDTAPAASTTREPIAQSPALAPIAAAIELPVEPPVVVTAVTPTPDIETPPALIAEPEPTDIPPVTTPDAVTEPAAPIATAESDTAADSEVTAAVETTVEAGTDADIEPAAVVEIAEVTTIVDEIAETPAVAEAPQALHVPATTEAADAAPEPALVTPAPQTEPVAETPASTSGKSSLKSLFRRLATAETDTSRSEASASSGRPHKTA